MELANKRALVTAAGQGIGRAIAEALADSGVLVCATDIDSDRLSTLSRYDRIDVEQLDVLDGNQISDLVERIGAVDILVNCAGVVHDGTVMEASLSELDFSFDLNVKSMMRTTRAVLPGMLERRDGAIVNVASVVSSVRGAKNRFVYGLTKAAVVGLTKSIAIDFVDKGIRCNAICPGTVDSPSLRARMDHAENPEEARKAFLGRQPMGRLGRAEEIADLAVYLAGASFTTGQTYVIDGGWTI